ncbi:hypothetical protein JL720_10671 [Aureococcus anophagefferens]|nr:hypothetical protein JL720_10671 [Aureococcus anophagefferens]
MEHFAATLPQYEELWRGRTGVDHVVLPQVAAASNFASARGADTDWFKETARGRRYSVLNCGHRSNTYRKLATNRGLFYASATKAGQGPGRGLRQGPRRRHVDAAAVAAVGRAPGPLSAAIAAVEANLPPATLAGCASLLPAAGDRGGGLVDSWAMSFFVDSAAVALVEAQRLARHVLFLHVSRPRAPGQERVIQRRFNRLAAFKTRGYELMAVERWADAGGAVCPSPASNKEALCDRPYGRVPREPPDAAATGQDALLDFAVVLVVEQASRARNVVRHGLGWRPFSKADVFPTIGRDASKSRKVVAANATGSDRALLTQHNQLDLALYAFANDLFDADVFFYDKASAQRPFRGRRRRLFCGFNKAPPPVDEAAGDDRPTARRGSARKAGSCFAGVAPAAAARRFVHGGVSASLPELDESMARQARAGPTAGATGCCFRRSC